MRPASARVWAVGLATIASLAGSSIASADDLQTAKRDAMAGARNVELRACPKIGDRSYIRGLTDPAQLTKLADAEAVFQDQALGQMREAMGNPGLSATTRGNLQTFASWSIAASAANWTLLQIAGAGFVDPLISEGKAHPATPLIAARTRLTGLADSGLDAEAAAQIRRLASAVDKCRKSLVVDTLVLNKAAADIAVDGARSTADLARIDATFKLKEAVDAGAGPENLDRFNIRFGTLNEAEEAARLRSERLSAAAAAKRDAEIAARLRSNLQVAQRFVAAAQASNERGAIAELAPDIVMQTPEGIYRGIDQVVAAVRQQSASGSSGSLGSPRIANDRIVANGVARGFSIITSFGFNAQNKIVRIVIST